jgi:hypothetical protein
MTNSSRQYVGRVEYLAHQTEILDLLKSGHSAKTIYEDLHKSGKITISYRNFCRYVKVKLVVSKTHQPSLPAQAPSDHDPTKFTHIKQSSAHDMAAEMLHGTKPKKED